MTARAQTSVADTKYLTDLVELKTKALGSSYESQTFDIGVGEEPVTGWTSSDLGKEPDPLVVADRVGCGPGASSELGNGHITHHLQYKGWSRLKCQVSVPALPTSPMSAGSFGGTVTAGGSRHGLVAVSISSSCRGVFLAESQMLLPKVGYEPRPKVGDSVHLRAFAFPLLVTLRS